jgi:hypothetical protein
MSTATLPSPSSRCRHRRHLTNLPSNIAALGLQAITLAFPDPDIENLYQSDFIQVNVRLSRPPSWQLHETRWNQRKRCWSLIEDMSTQNIDDKHLYSLVMDAEELHMLDRYLRNTCGSGSSQIAFVSGLRRILTFCSRASPSHLPRTVRFGRSRRQAPRPEAT